MTAPKRKRLPKKSKLEERRISQDSPPLETPPLDLILKLIKEKLSDQDKNAKGPKSALRAKKHTASSGCVAEDTVHTVFVGSIGYVELLSSILAEHVPAEMDDQVALALDGIIVALVSSQAIVMDHAPHEAIHAMSEIIFKALDYAKSKDTKGALRKKRESYSKASSEVLEVVGDLLKGKKP